MKRPLALLLLLLGGGGSGSGGQAFLIPPPSPRGISLKPQYHSHPSHGAAAPGATGAGRLCSSAASPLSPSRRRPRGALFASSSVDEQGGQPPPPPPTTTTTTPPSGRRRGQQRQQQRRRTGDDPAHRGKGRAPQQQQQQPQQQRQQSPQFGNLPAAPARPKKPVLTNVVSWLAAKFVRRIAKAVSGLDIDVGARSNGDVLAGNLPRVQAKFDRIVLEKLQISGGGQMEITGLNIRVLGLLLARRLNMIRRPFEIFGEYVLTQQDVSASKLIRDLIQLLVNTVLRTLFPSLHLTFFDVAIDQVRIRDQKLAIMGTASIAESEDGMPFTLLTGVGLAGDGHIVYLDNPELVLNPDAPLPVKVPLGSIRAFDVDIGDNARIERIEIDDRLGVSVTARTLITPAPPFHVTDVGKRAAFLYDLGAFFSSFFGFTHWEELNLES